MKSKKIKIHRSSVGVIHFDGDPVIEDKDLEVEIIPQGLNVIVGKKSKDEPSVNVIQQMLEYFNELTPIEKEAFNIKYSRLFNLNKQLLRRLSKK